MCNASVVSKRRSVGNIFLCLQPLGILHVSTVELHWTPTRIKRLAYILAVTGVDLSHCGDDSEAMSLGESSAKDESEISESW